MLLVLFIFELVTLYMKRNQEEGWTKRSSFIKSILNKMIPTVKNLFLPIKQLIQ